MLLSNRYNEETMLQEIEAFELQKKTLTEEINKLEKENKATMTTTRDTQALQRGYHRLAKGT